MHIGEGLLDLPILITLWIIVLGYGVISLFKIRKSVKTDQVAIISVITAMVFAFQMLNFPILAGTSGHIIGFVLMAIFFTPSTAFIMISVVLTIQAFVFLDGGIIALGANIFNMGIATLLGYFIYWIIRKKFSKNGTEGKNTKVLLIATFLGAYFSVIFASLICGIEIGISDNFPFGIEVTIPAMLFYHALIGIGEGIITLMVVSFFQKYAPEYIPTIENLPIWS